MSSPKKLKNYRYLLYPLMIIGFCSNQSFAQVTTMSPVTIVGALTYGLRNYGTYMDDVRNFELRYPKDLLSKTVENKFFTKDHQLILSIWRTNTLEGLNWNTEFEKALTSYEDAQVIYKFRKNDFFVISGFRGSNVFYRKEIINTTDDGQGFLVFEMTFPKAEKVNWEPILEYCLKYFGPIHTEKNYLTPVPTWTDEQWGDVVDKYDAANERDLEEEQKERAEQILKPSSNPITPNIIKPLPPTNIKITISNGMVFMTWEKVDENEGYCIFSPDTYQGFKDEYNIRSSKTFVHDPKYFIGYLKTLKQQGIHYYGIETILSGRGISAVAIFAIGPNDLN